jgi:hypothetical protein
LSPRLAVGIPAIAVVVGVLTNAMQFNAQFSTLNGRLGAIEAPVANFEARVDCRLELIEMGNRLTRVEERLEALL